jgi:predicted HD phosphohydrolase
MTFTELLGLYRDKGELQYAGEPVTQLEHAWQSLCLAHMGNASPALQLAAFFHDVGHLFQKGRGSPTLQDVDDRHEAIGPACLRRVLRDKGLDADQTEAIAEPVALHVEAKRYLVTVEPSYRACLSADSVRSLALQGGPMSDAEAARFERQSYFQDAVALRRWDEAAKQGAPEAALVLPPWEGIEQALYQIVAQCTSGQKGI